MQRDDGSSSCHIDCALIGRCQSDISQYQIRPVSLQVLCQTCETHVSPGAYGHDTDNCTGVEQSFHGELSALHIQYVDRLLLNQGVLSDSSYLKLFSTDVDPAYLVTCIGHVSFRVDICAIHVHQNRVWAIDFYVMSIYSHQFLK